MKLQRRRTTASGGKDNSSWPLRGLHSVLEAQLDHPLGPPTCSAGAHMRRRQRAHAELGFVRHGDSLLSAPCQLCLLGSSGNDNLLRPLLRCRKGSGWPALQQNEIKKGGGEAHFLNH